MSIELTDEQSEALSAEGDGAVVIDPRTHRKYRLVQEEAYCRMRALYDASPWTADEMARLAGDAFGKLDDTDYSHYLRESP